MNGYLLQALAVGGWWLLMAASERVYACFAFPGIGRTALFAFVLPDVLLIAGLSIRVWRRPHPLLQAVVLGAFAYGALWCVAASLVTRGGYLGSIVMMLGTLFNALLLMGRRVFRVTRANRAGANLAKTAAQSACIWGLALCLFPLGIVHATGGWPPSPHPASLSAGVASFSLFSVLGLWSGVVMAVAGRGTPLPLDAPQRLVVSGPYAYVRNPMAIAGLGQGFSVAIILNSSAVAVYVILGLVVWNAYVRPEEEAFMREQFGDTFDRYRAQVKCWMPQTRPYHEPEVLSRPD